jgi:hypothetical protein
MAALFDLLYREYCRAWLAEMHHAPAEQRGFRFW